MSSTHQPQYSSDHPTFSPIPDPWDSLITEPAKLPPHAWMVPPLDTDHELVSAPVHEAIMPHPISVARATEPIQSAVAILLADELKLADRADEHLRQEIGDAITLLELAAESSR